MSSKLSVYLLSIVAIILWGISYTWTDRLIRLGIPVFYFTFIRIFLAGIILLIFNLLTQKFQKIKRKDLAKFLLMALFEPFIYFLAESYGIRQTGSPTVSAMVIASAPIFSVAAGFIFFKERTNWINAIGITLTLGGLCLVVFGPGELGPNFVGGIILLLIAVFGEVGHATITKSLSQGYRSQTIVMYQFLIGSIYLLPFFIFGGLRNFEPRFLNVEVWIPIICLALLCSGIAFSLWVNTVRQLGVAKSSVFASLIPVVSAVAAWIIGREYLSIRQWLGVVISAAGVVLAQYVLKAHREPGTAEEAKKEK